MLDAWVAEWNGNIKGIFGDLVQQVIHKDSHGGNVLADGQRVTALVDCDHFCFGPRIYDVCYILVGFIRYNIADDLFTNAWLKVFSHTLLGYESIDSLSPQERARIWHGMLTIELVVATSQYDGGNDEMAQYNIDTIGWLFQHRTEINSRLPW